MDFEDLQCLRRYQYYLVKNKKFSAPFSGTRNGIMAWCLVEGIEHRDLVSWESVQRRQSGRSGRNWGWWNLKAICRFVLMSPETKPKLLPRTYSSIYWQTQALALVQRQNCKHVLASSMVRSFGTNHRRGKSKTVVKFETWPNLFTKPEVIDRKQSFLVIDVLNFRVWNTTLLSVIWEYEIRPWEPPYFLQFDIIWIPTTYLYQTPMTGSSQPFASCESSSRKTWRRLCVPSWNPRHGKFVVTSWLGFAIVSGVCVFSAVPNPHLVGT